MNPETLIWHTAKGESIKLGDMNNNHLYNVYHHCTHKIQYLEDILNNAWQVLCSVSGEMAEECIEKDIYRITEEQNKYRFCKQCVKQVAEKKGILLEEPSVKEKNRLMFGKKEARNVRKRKNGRSNIIKYRKSRLRRRKRKTNC